MVSLPVRKIGFLMSEKKRAKLNPAAFSVLCRENGFTLHCIDTEKPIEEQGPFTVIINKLTDIISQADDGCENSKQLICNFESYIRLHPEVVILDPPKNALILTNRPQYYSILQNSDLGEDIFFPTYVELSTTNVKENLDILKRANVSFPLVCKPTVAHGKSGAHNMSIVFNANGIKDCQPPCVVQTFVNHNAKLYKIFIIGKRYHITQRPSLRNFHPNDEPSIFFNSHDVSKPKSNSHLNSLSPEDAVEAEAEALTYRAEVVERIVELMRQKIGIDLMGVDVVIEKGSGRHAIIDINIFPGYESFPDYLQSLMDCIIEKTATNCNTKAAGTDVKEAPGEDSGCDTGNLCDRGAVSVAYLGEMQSLCVEGAEVDCHPGKKTSTLKTTYEQDEVNSPPSERNDRRMPDRIDDFTDGDSDCDINVVNGGLVNLEKVEGFQRIWRINHQDSDEGEAHAEESLRRTNNISLLGKDVCDSGDDDDWLGVVQLHWHPTYEEYLELESYWLAFDARQSTSNSSPVNSQLSSELELVASSTGRKSSYARSDVSSSTCEVSDVSTEEFECPFIEAEESARFDESALEVQGKSDKLYTDKFSVRNSDKLKVEEFLFGARSGDEKKSETRESPLPADSSSISSSASGDEYVCDFSLDDTVRINDLSNGVPNNDEVSEEISGSDSDYEVGREDSASSNEKWEVKKKPKKVKKFVLPLKWKLQYREKMRKKNKLRRSLLRDAKIAEKKICGLNCGKSDAARTISVKDGESGKKLKDRSAVPESSESDDELQKKRVGIMSNGNSSEQHPEKSATCDSKYQEQDSWLQDLDLLSDERSELKQKSALFALLRTLPSSSDSEDDARKKREERDRDSSLCSINEDIPGKSARHDSGTNREDSDSYYGKTKDPLKSRRFLSDSISSVLSRDKNRESGRGSSPDARIESLYNYSGDNSERPTTMRWSLSDSLTSVSSKNRREAGHRKKAGDSSSDAGNVDSSDEELVKQKKIRRPLSGSASLVSSKTRIEELRKKGRDSPSDAGNVDSSDEELVKQKKIRRSSSESASSVSSKTRIEDLRKKGGDSSSDARNVESSDEELAKQKKIRRSSSASSSSSVSSINRTEELRKKGRDSSSDARNVESSDEELAKQKKIRRSSSDSASSVSSQKRIEDLRKKGGDSSSDAGNVDSSDEELAKQKKIRRSSSDSASSVSSKKRIKDVQKKGGDSSSDARNVDSSDEELAKQKKSRRSSSASSSSSVSSINRTEELRKKGGDRSSDARNVDSSDEKLAKQKKSRRSASSDSASSVSSKKRIEDLQKKGGDISSGAGNVDSSDEELARRKKIRRSSSDSASSSISSKNSKKELRKKAGEKPSYARSGDPRSSEELKKHEENSQSSSGSFRSVAKEHDGEGTEEHDSLSEAPVVTSRNSSSEESTSFEKANRLSTESSDSALKRRDDEEFGARREEAGHDSSPSDPASKEENSLVEAMDSCCDDLAKNTKSDSRSEDSDSGQGPSLDASRSKGLRKKRVKRDRGASSIGDNREVLAKRDLLDSSAEESDLNAEKKMKCPLKMSRPSVSDSEDESPRGEKRSASEDGEPSKRRRPGVDDIDVMTDAKLLAGSFVSVKRMGEEHLEKYLLALQEEYLEKDDIDRLCNLNNIRYNGRSCWREENDEQKLRRAKIEKVKTRGRGLMDFFDEEDSDDPMKENGELDDEQKRNGENGIDTWNNVNKDNLLKDSDDEDSSSDGSGSDASVKKEKTKKRKEELLSGEEKENAANGESSKDDMDTDPVSSGEEDFVKKKKKNWRKNKLLVGKLSDTDSDEASAKAQRKKEKNDEEEATKQKRRKKLRRSVFSSPDSEPESKSSSTDTSDMYLKAVEIDAKRKKRRRIKTQDTSTDDDGIYHTPKKNRKRMRFSSFNYWSPNKETRDAGKAEEERRRRIAERQKMYDRMYSNLQAKAGGQKLDKLILDFDTKTKEPLVEVHPSIVDKLKPHQIEGVKFMWNACYESVARLKKTKGTGCILAHCMGLGKTFQVVALAHTVLKSPACMTRTILIVAPLSTVLNWCTEFEKWLSGLGDAPVSVQNLTDVKMNARRQWKLQEWYENGGVMVLGYEMYRNLSNPESKRFTPEMIATFQKTLVNPGPDLVVCDEGHLLKNEHTALARCMSKIRSSRRIVLTGTPLQNNLREYHVMVQFVKPHLLGTKKEFNENFIMPITEGQYENSKRHEVSTMKKKAHVLHQLLKGSVQRYDYSVLTPFLPPKEEYVICLRVTPLQEDLYNYYLDKLSRSAPDDDGRAISRYAALFKDFHSLLKVWTHPLVLEWGTEEDEKEKRRLENKRRGRKKLGGSDSDAGSIGDFIDDRNTSEGTRSSSSEDLDEAIEKKKKLKKKKKIKEKKEPPVVPPLLKKETKEVDPELPLAYWWKQFVTQSHMDDIRESPKLVLLFSILEKCEAIGEKVLVFSQSLFALDLIEYFLEKIDEATLNDEDDEKLLNLRGMWTRNVDYFRLDGSTATDVRAAWCRTFNKVDNLRGRLFLISTRAGGLGINLVAANRVIIFDASWNPSHDLQSIFRVYRFGQKKPVFVYRFLAQGTMEEKIYKRQVTKLSLAHRVIDEHQIDRHYNMKILQELYCFTPFVGPKQIPNCPKDHMLADLLQKHDDFIVSYHEHDSLLENKVCEELSEAERKEAWEEYEREKKLNAARYGDLHPEAAPKLADDGNDQNGGVRDGYAATLSNLPVPFGLPGPSFGDSSPSLDMGGSSRNSSPPPRSSSPPPSSSCPPSPPTPYSSVGSRSCSPNLRALNDALAKYFEDTS